MRHRVATWFVITSAALVTVAALVFATARN